MKNIRTYSRKRFSIKFSIWELNAISFARACNIPDDQFHPFNLDQFNYEFEKEHGLLNIVAEDIESYSYS